VIRDVLYVIDGRVVTSAGIASGIDLALHLVATAHGPAVAARIAGGDFNLRREVEALERQALQVALARAGGRPGAAARLLGAGGEQP